MLLHDSRRHARVDGAGLLVTLEEQDRSLWDRDQISEGLAVVEAALRRGRIGPYQLQAAIAAVHAEAATAEKTDWPQIAALYGELARIDPSPVVLLNRAVAVGMSEGAQSGLTLIDGSAARGRSTSIICSTPRAPTCSAGWARTRRLPRPIAAPSP